MKNDEKSVQKPRKTMKNDGEKTGKSARKNHPQAKKMIFHNVRRRDLLRTRSYKHKKRV